MKAQVMKALVVFGDASVRKEAVAALSGRVHHPSDIVELKGIEDAIEHLEKGGDSYALIVFESRGSSKTLVRAMIELGRDAAFIVCGVDEAVVSSFKDTDIPVDFIPIDSVAKSLAKTVKSLELSGKIPLFEESQSDYLSLRADLLPGIGVLQANVYMLILDGRYVPIFKKGDRVGEADLKHFLDKNSDQQFYFRRDECKAMLDSRIQHLEGVFNETPLDSKKAEDAISQSYALVRDVVTQVGFTLEAQKVSVLSVMTTIKLLGKKPLLKNILLELKDKEGTYIPSHSIYLGKVACALAHKIGWRSQSTYFKLSLAAFLHDISLKEDRLARVVDCDVAIESGSYTPEQIKEVRLHSAKAAEYARQFQEIPSEVEQIIAQHHERPNGNGFPRGLVVKYFTPLSALFVIAQDLIAYSETSHDMGFEEFFKERELEYNVGIFRKLARALRTDTTLL